jgi:hypothetical protein
MKLGTETVSVMNHLYSRATLGEPVPVVGMGATILAWSDRYAATIVSVEEFAGGRYKYLVGVVNDKCKVVAGSSHDGSAAYEYEPGGGTPRYWAKKKTSGAWVSVKRNEATGKLNMTHGNGLRIGERDEYRDPSF